MELPHFVRIFIFYYKIITVLERHEGDQMMTEFSLFWVNYTFKIFDYKIILLLRSLQENFIKWKNIKLSTIFKIINHSSAVKISN